MRSSLLCLAVSAAVCFQSGLADLAGPPQLPQSPRIPDQLVDVALNIQREFENNCPTDPDASHLFGNLTFDQYIDHNDTDAGTFQQRIWYNATYWGGPGSPIVMFTPAEAPGESLTICVTEHCLPGMIAREIGAAVVLVEMRYFGKSQPFDLLTTKNLQYLTIEQIVADFVRITRALKLPFDPLGSSSVPHAPWVWSGGSMAGSLGVYIERLAPRTFWATHASSAPIQTIYDFWQYFVPAQEHMPRNCSADWTAIIDHIDGIFESGTEQQQTELKTMFKLEGLEHAADFGNAICYPIYLWQGVNTFTGYSEFFQMCDAVEGFSANTSTIEPPTERGIGLEQALPNYAKWFRETYLPGRCARSKLAGWSDPYSVECWNTYNASSPMYAIVPETVLDRSLRWLTCSFPLLYYQTGPPPGIPALNSRLVTVEYRERGCALYFPPEGNYTYLTAAEGGKAAEGRMNALTGGWDFVGTERMFFVNGKRDSWLPATVASEFRPGGPYKGTERNPSVIMGNGYHESELFDLGAEANSEVNATQRAVIEQMGRWVNEFYALP